MTTPAPDQVWKRCDPGTWPFARIRDVSPRTGSATVYVWLQNCDENGNFRPDRLTKVRADLFPKRFEFVREVQA